MGGVSAELENRLAEARSKAETLDRCRGDLEEAMLTIGRIAGPDGLKACVAGVLLRVQLMLVGRAT